MSKKYWFKRKRYGWGWIPVTWQGWTIIGVWLAFIVFITLAVVNTEDESADIVWAYLAIVFLSVIPLILLGQLKGPKGKWRWGKSEKDDPDEDF